MSKSIFEMTDQEVEQAMAKVREQNAKLIDIAFLLLLVFGFVIAVALPR